MKIILDSPKGQLIVSCQALENESLYSPFTTLHMALAAAQGGAVGIRANGVVDIHAIKESVSLPVIGIIKRDYPGNDVFITAILQEADELMTVEPEIIALDATTRPRPGRQTLKELVTQIRARYPSVLLMVDIATVDEAVTAERLGFNCVGTTPHSYAADTAGHVPVKNNCGFLRDVLVAVGVPVAVEGNVDTPERTARCLALGAHIVVVGGAITRPQQITARLVAAIAS